MSISALLKTKPFIVQKIMFLVLFCLFNSVRSYSQIINEGVFHIENATTVYFGREYTNNGNYNNNGELFLNSNFINNGITTATAGTTFFASDTNAIQTISGTTNTINFYNLTINNSLSGVSVATNFGVVVENAVNLVDGDLRLTGEAQLVQTHTGTNVNSTTSGQLLKDQQGVSSANAFNYWSSPVSNEGSFSLFGGVFDGVDASLNPFTPQQILFSSSSPFNGVSSVVDGGGNVITPLTISTRWLYKYLQQGNDPSTWIKLDENDILNSGEGFTMKGTNTTGANQNYVFKGVPNDGDYNISVSLNQYFLIGNPYPSAIDSDEFIKDNISILNGGNSLLDNINGTLYFWVDGGSTSHNYSNYYGGYATRNLTGGAPPSVAAPRLGGLGTSEFVTPPERYIAVAQGFFVKGGLGTSVSFKNSQRVFKTESSGESIYYKNTNSKSNTEKSIVRIGYVDPEGFHRQLVLGFIPNSPANLNYNLAYDALMFGSRQDELFFIIDNDDTKKYVIQGVGAFNNSLELPLGLKITEEGTHSIMLDSLENFNNSVYIKDKLLNITYNLSESDFELNLPAGEYLDRFELVFQPQSTLGIEDFDKSQIQVYYNREDRIIINNKTGLLIEDVTIYNVLGQKIIQVDKKLLDPKQIVIPFNKNEGVYLVNVKTEYGEESYKILKNN